MRTLMERMIDMIEVEGDCWIWQGSCNPEGYGQVWVHDHLESAHRVMFMKLVGPIPEGHHLDHLCKVRDCVNPDHLEPVTPGENVRRAIHKRYVCKRGHLLSDNNVYVSRRGARQCRECALRRVRERRMFG